MDEDTDRDPDTDAAAVPGVGCLVVAAAVVLAPFCDLPSASVTNSTPLSGCTNGREDMLTILPQ